MERVDVTVVGAGAIGLATAARLCAPGRLVAVLEKNARYGQETSSRNSEVIHAGIYYAPGSFKALLCVRGRELLYRYCAERKIPCGKTGKLITAVDSGEEARLEALLKLGGENGASGLRLVYAAEITGLEPEIKARAALLSPETGIFSADLFMDTLAGDIRDKGAMLLTQTLFLGVEKTPEGYIVRAQGQEPFLSRLIINCAGHNADKVAASCGIDADKAGYRQKFVKGEYFRINSRHKISRPVYPPPDGQNLGLHLTPDLKGGIRIGPNAFETDGINYTVAEAHRNEFLAAARRHLQDLSAEQLAPDTAGARPRLVSGEDDFIIRHEADRGLAGILTMAGMESPGLTASLAIADYAAGIMKELL
jgi:L-2-hydroxyglutarate oxidase LhgO